MADVFDLATGDLVASERWIGVERAWPMRSAAGLLFQRFRTTDAGYRVVDVFGADLRER